MFIFKKIIITLIVLFSIVSALSPVCVCAESIWERRAKGTTIEKQEEKNSPESFSSSRAASYENELEPEAILIPDQYGTVIETHEGTNGKLIVHVQDAHMNYEAQKNEAAIIESLITDYGLNLILLEGRFTDENFDYVRERELLHARIEKADKLLKKGFINGIDYLNIASNYEMLIKPIEEKELYEKNINSLWFIDEFKGEADRYISRFIVAADRLKSSLYNADLKELDMKKTAYDTEKIDLLEYYEYMFFKAKEVDIPLYTFPNFTNLVRAGELEEKIDMVAIRDGSASDGEMNAYEEYLELTRNLNISDLFKEEPLLEGVLQDVLADNYDQKRLFRISRALSIIKNLLMIKVVPEEYRYFQENKRDFDPGFWSKFLEEKAEEAGITINLPADYSVISDNLPKIEKFYGLAAERNRVFLGKTEKHLARENMNTAILVAGGFHTPALTRLLKDNGYSYVVVSPKVTTETNDAMYRTALKRGTSFNANGTN